VRILIAAPLPRVFTYEWCLGEIPSFGQRVIVPWGNRLRVAMVHSVVDESESPEEFELKSVQACLDDGALLKGNWQRLIEFAADYYHYPLGLIALECLPKALRVLNAKGAEPVMVAKSREYALAAKSKRAQFGLI
jgi:primosomal protein N' (replication factor Y)